LQLQYWDELFQAAKFWYNEFRDQGCAIPSLGTRAVVAVKQPLLKSQEKVRAGKGSVLVVRDQHAEINPPRAINVVTASTHTSGK
jgi:hypothetical protein